MEGLVGVRGFLKSGMHFVELVVVNVGSLAKIGFGEVVRTVGVSRQRSMHTQTEHW